MSKFLLEAKTSVIAAQDRLQLYAATDWMCEQGRFNFDMQLSYGENARHAMAQSKPAVAEVLNLAQKRIDAWELMG